MAFKFTSANEFAHFSSHERPPASIFHEIFEISNFAPDLELHKSFAKIFYGTQQSNHNHQHISLNKLTGGNGNLSGRPCAIYENVIQMPENPVNIFQA